MNFARFDFDTGTTAQWFCDLGCLPQQQGAYGTYEISQAIPEPRAALVFALGLMVVAPRLRRPRERA
jgi:hypothetical protein